jgi:two-component system NtrC family sensor kinase
VWDQEKVVAALNLASHTHDALSANTRNVIETIASQLGGILARVTAEEELRASEERYRTLFDNVPVGLYRSTPEGQILDANLALMEMMGYSDREMLKRANARDLYVDPEERTQLQEMMAREGGVRDFEVRFRRHDGTSIWAEIDADAVRNADGSVTLYEGALQDITDRKRAEEALQESEELFRSLFEYAPIGMAITDLDGRYLRVNQAHCDALGYTEEEMLTRKFVDITPSEDVSDNLVLREKALQGEISQFQMEKRFISKPGKIVDTLLQVSLIRDAQGEPLYFIGQIVDITDRKRAEEALREERDRAQKYLDVAGVMLVALNDQGQITLMNRRGLEILEYDEGELLGADWFDTCLPTRNKEEVKSVFGTLMAGDVEPVKEFENPILTKTGEERVIAWQNTLLADEAGRIVGTLSSGQDITDRKRAEEALRRSEATLQSILRAAPVGIGLVTDRILGWSNDTLRTMLGYSGEELAGQSARMLYETEEEFLRVGREKYADIQKWGTGSLETRFRHKDGHIIDILLSSTPLDPEDLLAGVVFSALDITKLKQTEKALRRSEARYRGFVEQSYQGVWEIDGDGVTTFANSRMANILGYDEPVDVMGHKFHNFAPRAYVEFPLPGIGQRGATNNEAQDFTLKREDGSVVHAILSHMPHFDEAGRFAGATLFVTDITERKQAEQALRESENRYRTLFESAGDAIFIHDLAGRFLAVNNLACERLMYRWEELLQMTRMEIDVPEHAALIPDQIEQVRRFGQGLFETVHVRRDRTTVPVELSCRLIAYEGMQAILCIARDLTERKQMEQYVLRTERLAAMGHLAAALAHEINNPLQSIGSSIELVLDFPLEESEKQDYLAAVRQEIERLMALTGRVLDFARPPRVERYSISVPEVVHHALSLAGKQLMHSRIGVNENLPDDLFSVRASRDQLAQVFLNLILNAVEAMPDGGRLSISARATEEQVELSFQDTGPGIQEDDFERVFEPFHTTKENGTGLGLAVSYSIIQQHGGTITANNAPEGGAVFTVILPTAL